MRELAQLERKVLLKPCVETDSRPFARDLSSIPKIVWADDSDSCVIMRRSSSIPGAAAPEITQEVLIPAGHSEEIKQEAAEAEFGIVDGIGLPELFTLSKSANGQWC